MDVQQHNTRKARKKQKSKQQIMKNVLLTPYKRSWPILVPEHQKEFDYYLHSNLSALVPQVQPKIPWSVLKGIPKEQRKEIRQKYRQPIDIDSNLRKSLIFGVNECTKALEQHKILAVLISSTCNPEIMVNHVIRIAERRKIAVLVINSLKETLRKLVGFPCVCLGFRKHKKLKNLGKLRQIVDFIYRIKNMKIDDILGTSAIINLELDPKEIKHIDNNNIIEESLLKANNLGRQKSVIKNSKKGLKKSNFDLENSPNLSTITIYDSPTGIIPISEKNIPNTVQDLNKINDSDIIMLSDYSEYSFGDSVQFIDDSANRISINNAYPILNNPERIVATDLPTSDQNSTNTSSDFIAAIVTSNDEATETGPYLYRTSTKKRVFEPTQVQVPPNAVKTCSDTSSTDDYIAFSDNSIKYVPSIIKRMKGNKKNKKKNI